tara:strand:- start:104 stop:895 length:792 start_codon:yes stop_codon:yes gene_type:complete
MISETTAALALQGPNSRKILNSISGTSLNDLKFFYMMDTNFNGKRVSISRTGYTGDLGYEIWINQEDALTIWDLLLDKGKSYGITPTGLHALDISRIEAGLILLDVDYVSSRHAIIESRKSSPFELGLGWAVKMNKNDFIGKNALKKELDRGPEWKFVGIEIEWSNLEEHYRRVGLAPGLPSTAWRTSTPLYYNSEQIGYATSGTWSPILKKYIALAHVKNEYSDLDTILDFEIKIEHFKKTTTARIVNTPFFNPERKRSCPT